MIKSQYNVVEKYDPSAYNTFQLTLVKENYRVMKIAYIMRGVPGSGKSTMVQRLIAGESSVAVHSTDSYFMVDGTYVFDGKKLQEYHDRNRAAFEQSLRDGVEVVVCDNTNVRVAHMLPYIQMARRHGYTVRVIEMPHPTAAVAAGRNTHGANQQGIQRMLDSWEPWQG